MTRQFCVITFSFIFLGVTCETSIDPLVNTDLGPIRGLISDDGGYAMYLGVPYALVNESNPFGPSLVHPSFNDTFNAYNESSVCPQYNGVNYFGEIQCLQLNIYVPNAANSSNKLPVMIWIHGGAFVAGNGNRAIISPDYLINKDVILVTLHYRLGVFGFLCLDTPQFPGNQGLKDQVLGLKWIYENIDAFDGDENKITIFGNSAGAMSVNLHVLTNQGDYFHRAIIESGPALSPWLISEANQSIPFDIAYSLGYVPQDLNDAMKILSNESPESVAQKAFELYITNSEEKNMPLTRVCIEKKFEGVENFLIDYPMNINSTKIKSIPIIIGFNDKELAFQYGNAPKEWFENYSYGNMLEFDMNDVDSENVEILKHFYTGDKVLGDDVREEITNFASDYVFLYPTERMMQNFLKECAIDIFHYEFSYVGKRNYLTILVNLTTEGASHADELGYIFKMDMFENATHEKDMQMVEVITTLWTNFAKYGNPTPETTDLITFTWTPVTESTRPYLSLSSDLGMKNRPFAERLSFWDLFYKINLKNLKGYTEEN